MKALLLTLLFLSQIFACDLCSAYTPVAHIKTTLITDQDKNETTIIGLNFDLKFSKNYSDLMLQISDRNADNDLNKEELLKASEGVKEFFEGKNFLENVIFKESNDKAQLIEPKLRNFILTFENKELGANLKFDIWEREAKSIKNVILNVNQSKQYFIFAFLPQEPQRLNDKLSFLSTAPLTKRQIATEHNIFAIVPTDKIQEFQAELIDTSKLKQETPEEQNIISKQTNNYLNQLKSTFKENALNPNLTSIFIIIFLSFLYGLFHAAGPGHAKTLSFSLFAATGENYLKAFRFALQIGILHTLGAFLLVCLIVFSVSGINRILGGDVIRIATIVSGGLIVLIALSMLISLILKRNRKYSWKAHSDACDCITCSKLKAPESLKCRKWLVAACASLIPCPGTVLVFLLAFEIGSYGLGLLSGIFMSLGMSVIIFLSAVLGRKVNISGSKILKDYDYVKFSALLIMLILGVMMIFI